MIQIITYGTNKYKEYPETTYKISRLGEIQALDDFEICIIDLSSEYLWRYDEIQPTNVNCYKDLLTIKEAITNSVKSKILIILPQNELFYYYKIRKHINSRYEDVLDKHIYLKDNKENLVKIINNNLLNMGKTKLLFEKTRTVVEDMNIEADFNFTNYQEDKFEALTFSKNSNKITTIRKDNIFITTLNILENMEILKVFINNYCNEKQKKEEKPEWINNIKFFNDEQLSQEKSENIKKIEKLEEENEKLDKQLEKKLEYKSILYTNRDELVKVV